MARVGLVIVCCVRGTAAAAIASSLTLKVRPFVFLMLPVGVECPGRCLFLAGLGCR